MKAVLVEPKAKKSGFFRAINKKILERIKGCADFLKTRQNMDVVGKKQNLERNAKFTSICQVLVERVPPKMVHYLQKYIHWFPYMYTVRQL